MLASARRLGDIARAVFTVQCSVFSAVCHARGAQRRPSGVSTRALTEACGAALRALTSTSAFTFTSVEWRRGARGNAPPTRLRSCGSSVIERRAAATLRPPRRLASRAQLSAACHLVRHAVATCCAISHSPTTPHLRQLHSLALALAHTHPLPLPPHFYFHVHVHIHFQFPVPVPVAVGREAASSARASVVGACRLSVSSTWREKCALVVA